MNDNQLVMIASAPVLVRDAGALFLDTKFVEGMRLHQALWHGPVACILWKGQDAIPFGAEYRAADLGFDLTLLEPGQAIEALHLARAAVVAASADIIAALEVAPLCRAAGARLVYTIEYTLATRLRIAALDRSRGPLRKARSMLWNLGHERRRRAAFRAADGVQFNGYPARDAYSGLTRDGLLFLDGRMRRGMMARDDQMQARADRLAAGAPLRIVHSGRLVAMKGAQDLLPVAAALRGSGMAFTLDIFGTGELHAEISKGIVLAGMHDQVRLHPAVDFETGLVPFLTSEADVFLSCHRQADPSCSYLESLSCGVPVVGYDNAMWRALCAASGAGWVVPMGRIAAMAAQIATLARDPASVTAAAARALAFGRLHDVESEFALRMAHLAKRAGPSGR